MSGDDATGTEPAVRMLYCRCAFAQVIPADVKAEVLEGLAAAGVGFEAVADLCDMAARRDPHLLELSKGQGTLRIAACWPRAVRGLFHLADAPLPGTGVEILNMRTLPGQRVLHALLHGDPAAVEDSDAPRDAAAKVPATLNAALATQPPDPNAATAGERGEKRAGETV
jgi:hypothetical protein